MPFFYKFFFYFLGHGNPSIMVKAVTFLLQNSTTPEQLALLIKILTNELIDKTSPPYSEKGGHFSVVLEQLLSRCIQKFTISEEEDGSLQMWNNLLTLLKYLNLLLKIINIQQ